MTLQTLIFRADASIAMGTGHVMRCLALGQAWRDAGGSCVFAMRESTLDIAKRLQREGMEVISISVAESANQDASIVGELLRHYSASWVVVDGYQFDHNISVI